MDMIRIEATDRSPEVVFDFDQGRFTLSGESYPEDSAAFFAPLLAAVRTYLSDEQPKPVTFDLSMHYFNSSSAKALMNLFQDLEEAAEQGWPTTVNWHYHPDDDTMAEFGEDFALDFNHAEFRLCPTPETA
ncbi:DUF1987 domain-containing protein [Roseospira marina]|uniref:DUF1987 domain-containing protein n=2 Tax=Roseospira marina TaxID=140057 RepID=A0A5M6I8D6_9PROT|nr:DUF1987 domain-containing protein [Roseospira marina]KAA5604520.1 DUF1987 domain-containing protein [Roseospira marina]MBB5088549.1 hypothetical protein [Roseospira marina]